MLAPMLSMLAVIIAMAVVVMVVAAFAEGRGRHLLRLALGLRSRATLDEVLAPVPRDEADWELVADLDSSRDRPAPGDRAAAWARVTATHAVEAVETRASALREARETPAEQPRTGELGLARQ